MSFLYPRRIAISRPPKETFAGEQPYGDVTRDEERPVLSDLPASIQQTSSTRRSQAQLPGSARANTIWQIFIPRRALGDRDAIQFHDIVTDDLGHRYQVTAPYWNSLGFNLLVEHLQV